MRWLNNQVREDKEMNNVTVVYEGEEFGKNAGKGKQRLCLEGILYRKNGEI